LRFHILGPRGFISYYGIATSKFEHFLKVHLVVGLEQEARKACDLAVQSEIEGWVSGSNRDLYRPEAVVAASVK
jgi:hypothetical protein